MILNPTPVQLEILGWFALRSHGTRWANIPQHWKAEIWKMIRRAEAEPGREVVHWLVRHNVGEIVITEVGRMLAAAYRHGRAAAPREESRTA